MNITLDNIFCNELIFLLKYLEGKRDHKERFDQFIIVVNGFHINLHEFMDIALSTVGSLYIETVKKSDKYYVLKLTSEGKNILNMIKLLFERVYS